MKVRFQSDADFNEEIVSGMLRREPEVDFQTSEEAELRGRPDPEVLARAAREGRILVSHDRRTMPRHFADFIQQHERSPGVIIISQRVSVRRAIEELLLIWEASEGEEWVNLIIELPF
jgi:predicted nuclease of predicted toxin-antitoxin system